MNIHEAPAKINLVLRVGRERDDGYHEIVSLMARVDVVDVVMVVPAPRMSVTCPDIPGGDTLVTRALHALKHATHHPGGFHVGIAKRIPIGSGLGGGSSDAAAALRAANAQLARPLDDAELEALAAEVGSDVPFFLGPPVAIVRGRGTECAPGPALPPCAFVIAHPGRPLATRDVYEAYTPTAPLATAIPAPQTIEDLAGLVGNDLGPVAEELEPRCRTLREALLARGARAASVTGTGSAVFGLFATSEEAEAAATDLPGAAWSRAATLSRT